MTKVKTCLRDIRIISLFVLSLVLIGSLCACHQTATTINNTQPSSGTVKTPTPQSATTSTTPVPENQTIVLPLDFTTYEISPNDIRYVIEGFTFQRFCLEHPTVFKLADTNNDPFPHWEVHYTDVKFLYNPGYGNFPNGEIRVAIIKPGGMYKKLSDVVEGVGMGVTKDDVVESSTFVDGIPATQVSFYHHNLTTKGEVISSSFSKYAIFEHQGDFWEISIFWFYFESKEPPEINIYFQQVIETFHFVD